MKLFKSIALILLSSVLAVSTANASNDTKQQQKKTQKSSQQKNKKDEKKDKNNKNSKDNKNNKDSKDKKTDNKKTDTKKTDNKKTDTPKAENKNLKLFNDSVSIKVAQANIVENDDKQQALRLTYSVENKTTDADIQALHWVTGFVSNNNTFYVQDMPAKFQDAVKRGNKLEFISIIPFEQMPENARKIFLSQDAKIDSLIGAKSLTFADGQKIEIK